MKTRLALTAYYFAISVLILLTGVIVVKLIFWPPCTQVGSSCTVDGWSIAGLAAMILGVSATVLAILGTVTVAGWWTLLDKRVRNQVTVLFDAERAQLRTQVDALLAEQKKKVDEQLLTFQTRLESLDYEIDGSKKDIGQLHRLINDELEFTLDVAVVSPPWEIDAWASAMMKKYKLPGLAKRMVFKYLSYIDLLLSEEEESKKSGKFMVRMTSQGKTLDVSSCWEGALRWQKVFDDAHSVLILNTPSGEQMLGPEIGREVHERMEIYRPKIQARANRQEQEQKELLDMMEDASWQEK